MAILSIVIKIKDDLVVFDAGVYGDYPIDSINVVGANCELYFTKDVRELIERGFHVVAEPNIEIGWEDSENC